MRTAWAVPLLLALLAGPGCWELPTFLQPPPPPPPPPVVEAPKAPPPPVTPDRVTETNAHQMANKLAEELDRAELENQQ